MRVCSLCKSQNLKEIEIITKGAFTVIEIPKGFSINPKSSKINKYVCLECGHIDLYVNDVEIFR